MYTIATPHENIAPRASNPRTTDFAFARCEPKDRRYQHLKSAHARNDSCGTSRIGALARTRPMGPDNPTPGSRAERRTSARARVSRAESARAKPQEDPMGKVRASTTPSRRRETRRVAPSPEAVSLFFRLLSLRVEEGCAINVPKRASVRPSLADHRPSRTRSSPRVCPPSWPGCRPWSRRRTSRRAPTTPRGRARAN